MLGAFCSWTSTCRLRELSPCVRGVLFLKGVGVVLGGWDSMGEASRGKSEVEQTFERSNCAANWLIYQQVRNMHGMCRVSAEQKVCGRVMMTKSQLATQLAMQQFTR